MANAGRHRDTKILKDYLHRGKLIKILPEDNRCHRKIKELFNDLILSDQPENRSHNGHKYIWHSAWSRLSETLITANQIRQRYWHFDPLNLI